MLTMTKRNLQLYFYNKASVFSSLLGALIAFVLYIVFLQKNMLDAWSSEVNAEIILNNWVIGGTLAVTSITTTWTGVARLIRDKETHKLDDFLLTDTSRFRLYMGYLLSASIIGFIMQMVMLLIMEIYFKWQDNLTFDFDKLPLIIVVMILSSVMGAVLALLVVQFVSSVEVNERLSIIIGTASGFLVGVYIPIGTLPDFAQTVVKVTPGAYVSASYRQILLSEKISDWSLPHINVNEYLGIGLMWGKLTTLNQNILITSLILGVGILFLGGVLLAQKFQKR
jgi:multidrug/hemolysin transport system permease protein